MNVRIFLILITTLALGLPAHGEMARVSAVIDGQTLTVESRGTARNITLAGIEVLDDHSARELMLWTLVDTWVMVERVESGAFVYRSPDALFVNRELVSRGFAKATLHGVEPESNLRVTYLGSTMNASEAGARRRSEALLQHAPKVERGSDSEPSAPKPARRSRSRRAPKP